MYISQLIVSIGFSATAALAAIQAPFLAPESTVKQDVLSPEIDTFIEKILADWNSPGGVGIAVVQKNEDGSWNVETKGYGVAKADGSKVTADTLFAIGSNSKLFDIIATGLLISNESLSPRISWNTKISSIIPEWEMSDPVASSESTIIDLMSHRTGLPGYDEVYYEKQSLSSLISKIKYLRPSAGFRETWQYNNMMYTTLSYIPEVLLKVPFTRYVKEHIFLPLNLTSTTYSADIAEESGNLANGFEREGVNKTEDIFGVGTTRALPYWAPYGGEDGHILSGAGGIISSAKDVATWLQTLLLEGKNPANDEQVIPSAVIQKVATGITVVDGTTPYPELAPSLYGGGQLISSYRGHNFIEHGGGTTGFHTQITRFPFDNFGVAVLSNDNSYGTLFMRVIKWRIVDQVLGLEPVDWNSRYKNQAIKAYEKEVQDSVPRPADPTPPSVSFSSLQGRYHNPAYGILDLCGILPSISSSDSSSSCKDFIEELSIRLPGAMNVSAPTFFARMDKVWTTHIRFQHFNANVFNASGLLSLPIIDSGSIEPQAQQYWVHDASAGDNFAIEFALDPDDNKVAGFGFTGGFWGAGPGVGGPVGETVRERAEVWYERI